MTPSLSILAYVLLGAVSVTPQTLPSAGKQEAIVTIQDPGMYQIRATSPEGVACQIVDHLRGPFQQSGIVGKQNCDMALLLDAGVNKLRLEAPRNGKGQIQLQVRPFEEINPSVVRLPHRRSVEQVLHPGQQASYWVRVEKRRFVLLRVFGRTAGMVRLWRDGKWVEELQARSFEVVPKEGQAIYEWHLSGMLESGDYRLEVYGANPKRWTKGKEQDFLYVQNGMTLAPAGGTVSFNLPAWGKVAYEVSQANVMGYLSLDRPGSAATRLTTNQMPDKSGDRVYGRERYCRIEPKALVPTCATWSTSGHRHVLTVNGKPGTTGQLQWASYTGSTTLADGQYTGVRDNFNLQSPRSGRYLVSVHDLPTDIDAAPLSCQLESTRRVFLSQRYRDFLVLGKKRGFDRAFNYNGHEETIWFQVTEANIFKLATAGELKNRCVLYRLDGQKRTTLKETDPGAKTCQIAKHLPEGQYELKIYGGKEGIEKLQIVPQTDGFHMISSSLAVTKNSCLFQGVKIDRHRQKLSYWHWQT